MVEKYLKSTMEEEKRAEKQGEQARRCRCDGERNEESRNDESMTAYFLRRATTAKSSCSPSRYPSSPFSARMVNWRRTKGRGKSVESQDERRVEEEEEKFQRTRAARAISAFPLDIPP